MITVEYNPDGNDVCIFVDDEGASYLSDLILALKSRGIEDHEHLFGDSLDVAQNELSGNKMSSSDRYRVATLLTLAFRIKRSEGA